MKKILKLFFVFLVAFGMIGEIGLASVMGTSGSSTTSSNNLKTITIAGITLKISASSISKATAKSSSSIINPIVTSLKETTPAQQKILISNYNSLNPNDQAALIISGIAKNKQMPSLTNFDSSTLINLAGATSGNNKQTIVKKLTSQAGSLSLNLQKAALGLNDPTLSSAIFAHPANVKITGSSLSQQNQNILALCQANHAACLQNVDKATLTAFSKDTSNDGGKQFLASLTKQDIVNCIDSGSTCKNAQVITDAYNKEQCSEGLSSFDPFCSLLPSITVKETYLSNVQNQISNIKNNPANLVLQTKITLPNKKTCSANENTQDCINLNCKQNQNCIDQVMADSKIDSKNLNNLNNQIIQKTIDVLPYQLNNDQKNTIYTACQNAPTSTACSNAVAKTCKDSAGKDSANCIYALKEGLSQAYGQSETKTNDLFTVLNALANPDQNALNAAKLFGFEPNYNNVPKMLKQSFASQICEAKINGYLDTTRSENGGITTYGCSQTLQQKTNANTGQVVTAGNPNCINVLLDLRAQRTQITPDNKVTITYSLYLKAPSNEDLKYFLAIAYKLKDGSTKKQLLKPAQKFTTVAKGSVKTDYETVNLPLNVSRNLIDDSTNSFRIGILALDSSTGAVYQQKSVNIPLITTTDNYNGISSTSSSASSTSSQNTYKTSTQPLSSQSMLNMINI